jgi:hypothetical protein
MPERMANVRFWPFASFRGGAEIRSLSEHSGLSGAYRMRLSVASDPQRSYAGAKSRSAALSRQTRCAILSIRSLRPNSAGDLTTRLIE